MAIDLPTLMLAGSFVTAASGLFLVFAWMQNREAVGMVWWATGNLTLALAVPSVLGTGEEVPRLSAAMFSIGYGFAVVVALLAGQLWNASGLAVLAVLPFAATAALPGLLAWSTLRRRDPLPSSG